MKTAILSEEMHQNAVQSYAYYWVRLPYCTAILAR
jgi:hypothetical protein